MATGTLDLNEIDQERRRREAGELSPDDHARSIVEEVLASAQTDAAQRLEQDASDDDDSWTIARSIVEDVLATEAALDSTVEVDATQPEWSLGASGRPPRRHLVFLSADEPLVLVPGPVYEPGVGAWTPQSGADDLSALVDLAIGTVRATPQTVSGVLRGAADSADMPATRWILVGILWMAAFAGLVPFAFATIGNALDMEIDIYGEATAEEPAIEQQAPDVSETTNPSVDNPADSGQDG